MAFITMSRRCQQTFHCTLQFVFVTSFPHSSHKPDVFCPVSPQISIPLSTAFGVDTEGAQWIVGYLLEKVINNLSVWSSETELANDTVELLVTLVEKRER